MRLPASVKNTECGSREPGVELDIDSETGKGLLSTCLPGLSSQLGPWLLLICLRR